MEISVQGTADYSPAASGDVREIVLAAGCAGMRLDQALAQAVPEFSRTQLRGWVDAGLVTIDGRPAVAKHRVFGGERVLLQSAPSARASEDPAQALDLRIVFEDDHVIVIDKHAGLVVHPGAGNQSGTLLNALLAHAPGLRELPRAGIVHRLDKDTTGLLVVAKTLSAQTALARQLHERSVSRIYHAVVHGRVNTAGVVDAPIGRHPIHRTRMAVVSRGRAARTHYRPLALGKQWTLLECRLESGRTHQIRVHMDHLGHPLLGDPVYGPRRVQPALATALGAFSRQALHAVELRFDHPADGVPWQGESPLPQDMAELLRRLEAAAC